MIRLILLLILAQPVLAISYKTIEHNKSKIHAVIFDPLKYQMQIVKAIDSGLGRENLLSIYERTKPIAAINGSFFDINGRFNGLPAFLLKINDNIYISNSKYPIIYWSKNTLNISEIKADPHIIIDDITRLPATINMVQRKPNIIVFTKAYHHSTLLAPGNLEITVKDNHVINISKKGNSIIPENGFVISSNKLPQIKIGTKITLDYGIPEEVNSAEYIMSGSDMLLNNGEIIKKRDGEFFNKPYARTGICILKNNKIGLFAIENTSNSNLKNSTISEMIIYFTKLGYKREDIYNMNLKDLYKIYEKEKSQTADSVGLSLEDFAKALKKEGCINAINLDGGSSSGLIYKNNVITNSPMKPIELADAIIVKKI